MCVWTEGGGERVGFIVVRRLPVHLSPSRHFPQTPAICAE